MKDEKECKEKGNVINLKMIEFQPQGDKLVYNSHDTLLLCTINIKTVYPIFTFISY